MTSTASVHREVKAIVLRKYANRASANPPKSNSLQQRTELANVLQLLDVEQFIDKACAGGRT